MDFAALRDIFVVGIIATLGMDLAQLLMRLLFGWPTSNWGVIGRWVAGLSHGRFVDHQIGSAPPVKNEVVLGWLTHYAVGIVYAAIYLFLVIVVLGIEPGFLSAMVFGLGVILWTWFGMEPALGAGPMGAHTPDPTVTRLQDLGSHTGFGLGLYVGTLFI